jgi:N-acetylmuramic acid 6-phosphate (MurNAc-6-P) etherase
MKEKIGRGGRVFLVGSGSSGRVGIDIAAKCGIKFPTIKKQIEGVIAGGDSALIRAKEGFEDSEADGEAALKDYNLGPNDTVILISASGSASFNAGCGHFAANRDAGVYYFYNSNNIPMRTQRLFERKINPVIPLCVDIYPKNLENRLFGLSESSLESTTAGFAS